jgi:hypothetical protein
VYHVELRQDSRSARAFNLTSSRLAATVLEPWKRGDTLKLGDQEWDPSEADLTIYEGRELRPDELGMGRGWSSAVKTGEDVTARVLAGPAAAAEDPPAIAKFKADVLAQCGSGRIGLHQVVWLANDRYGAWRVSDRIALAERAVWELLHQGRIRMLDAAGEVERARWEPVLLAWDTWAGHGPSMQIEAT